MSVHIPRLLNPFDKTRWRRFPVLEYAPPKSISIKKWPRLDSSISSNICLVSFFLKNSDLCTSSASSISHCWIGTYPGPLIETVQGKGDLSVDALQTNMLTSMDRGAWDHQAHYFWSPLLLPFAIASSILSPLARRSCLSLTSLNKTGNPPSSPDILTDWTLRHRPMLRLFKK